MVISHLRYALRLLRLQPGSSAAIVLTLALAIGANTTLFTLINAALLAPLPVSEPDRLMNVYTSKADGSGYGGLSYPDFLDLRAGTQAFEGVLGYSGLMATITDKDRSEVIFGEMVTASYFSLLGVAPALGRGFHHFEDEAPGAHPVVVISHRLVEPSIRRRSCRDWPDTSAERPHIHHRRRRAAGIRGTVVSRNLR